MMHEGYCQISRIANGYLVTLSPPVRDQRQPHNLTADTTLAFLSLPPALLAIQRFLEDPRRETGELTARPVI